MARQHLGQQHAAGRRLDPMVEFVTILIDRAIAAMDPGMHGQNIIVERLLDLVHRTKHAVLAQLVLALDGHVVEPQHHILRGHDDGFAVGRTEDVVGRHHQHPRLELRLKRERHVYGHLVTVEVGIEGGADQGMKLDRLAFDEHRLEGLDTQPVQRRRPVE